MKKKDLQRLVGVLARQLSQSLAETKMVNTEILQKIYAQL